MAAMRALPVLISSLSLAACAPLQSPVVFDLRPVSTSAGDVIIRRASVETSYSAVTDRHALILGCNVDPNSPVCAIAVPNAEEDSAFRSEGERLIVHSDPRCRRLGAAINANESQVRMYRKALIRETGTERLYGVGHAYELGFMWHVRVARRIDDLNERTIGEKKRTLRHEMSHTIGATETAGSGWTAEDYATNCG
jgi:hypothetical protein